MKQAPVRKLGRIEKHWWPEIYQMTVHSPSTIISVWTVKHTLSLHVFTWTEHTFSCHHSSSGSVGSQGFVPPEKKLILVREHGPGLHVADNLTAFKIWQVVQKLFHSPIFPPTTSNWSAFDYCRVSENQIFLSEIRTVLPHRSEENSISPTIISCAELSFVVGKGWG